MKMSNISQPEFERPLMPATRMRGEIVHQYGKFTDQEITVLNDRNDFVAGSNRYTGSTGPRRKPLSMGSRKGGS